MDSFSDLLLWVLFAVVFWAILTTPSSKRKNTKEDDIQIPTSCGCDPDTGLNLCPVCTIYAEEKAFLQKNTGKRRIIN
jgi:hypothetical protein